MEQPNLSYINTLSGGDKAFETKLIGIIKQEYPEERDVYFKNFKAKNYKLAAENVHKLKHKINILGLNESYKVAEKYEHNLIDNITEGKEDFANILQAITNFLNGL